jgi:hypothetical protein
MRTHTWYTIVVDSRLSPFIAHEQAALSNKCMRKLIDATPVIGVAEQALL